MTHTQLSQLVQAFIRCAKKHSNCKRIRSILVRCRGHRKQVELTKQLVSVAEQNIALIDEVIDYARSERAIQSLRRRRRS